jgi:hypothetical protein
MGLHQPKHCCVSTSSPSMPELHMGLDLATPKHARSSAASAGRSALIVRARRE